VANHPSAEKRNRQRIVRTERNRQIKSSVRTAVKAARLATAEKKDVETVKAAVHAAIVSLDKAGAKGAFHRKTVARRIGRLAAMVHKASKVPAAPPSKVAKPAAKKTAAKKKKA
jgi:small subunit ribosomal protein S20